MENKNEGSAVGARRVSKRKVVAAALFLAMLGTGAFLFFSGSARRFLRQGSAIALKSAGDAFRGASSDAIVSEVDIVPSGTLGVVGEVVSGTPAATTDIAAKKENNSPKDFMDAAGVVSPPAVLSGILPAPGNSSTRVSISDRNGSNDAVSSSTAPVKNSLKDCPFPAVAPSMVSHQVILSEIAWMGQPTSTGVNAESAANGEWMELKNISGAAVSLDGWRIVDAGGKIKIVFGSGDSLAPDGLYLLSRGGNPVYGISADKTYSGTLPNSGDELAVLDAACGASDFLDASSKWPGGSNATKQTLERKTDLGWQTSALAGGTPRAENSAGTWVAPVISSSTEKYVLNVMVAGNGGGKVTIKPGGATCTTSCTNEFAKGTTVTILALPDSGVDFTGWSGGCSGTAGCSFVMTGGPILVMAGFHRDVGEPMMLSDIPASGAPDDAGSSGTVAVENSSSSADGAAGADEEAPVIASSSSSPDEAGDASSSVSGDDVGDGSSTAAASSPPAAVLAVSHLVIAAVQIAGAASSDDFVKIYDPTPSAVDMSGWKLRKKSSTGTDSSLREFPKGSVVAAGGYFTWASSANGFAQSIGADASSTGTLAANNSVALFDATGAQIDAVAWGTGTGQYGEGAAYPASPTAGQVLQRKFANGAVVDTDNNNNDFTL